MALTSALEIARRALTANETALGVIANNIANANTPGYSRQLPEMAEDRATLSPEGLLLGRGVHVGQIRQVIDPLIQKRLVRAQAEQAGLAARRDELSKLATILGDVDEPSLSQLTDKFFDAADALARNPGGLAERENLLGSGNGLAAEFNRRRDAVATLQRTVDDRYVQLAGIGNDALTQIASLNTLILTREASGARANDLRDQRSAALSTIAQKIGVDVQENADGAVRVQARDGTVLVDGGQVVHRLSVQSGTTGLDGSALHTVGFTGPGTTILSRPEAFATGQLGQLAAARDTDINTAVARLDTIAASLVTRVNAIQTSGYDLDQNLATSTPLLSGTGAADFAVAITDPREIAAGTSIEAGDNRNALRISDLRRTGLAELSGTTYAGYLSVEQARLGGLASLSSESAAASELVTRQLEAERNELSGVNLNEELVNLLRFQRAFQAAAQVVNVASTTIDELLQLVR